MARSAASNRFVLRNYGTALSFPGASSANVKVASPLSIPTTGAAVTLSVWLNLNTLSTTQNIWTIINNPSSAAVTLTISGGFVVIQKFAGSTLVSAKTKAAVPIGIWTHIVFTWDATTNSLYINGLLNNTSVTAHNSAATANIFLSGFNGSNSQVYNGFADEACIWNRALSASEVTQLYNGIPPTSGLVLQWLLNEGSGSSTTDSSGTGNTGAITAATYASSLSTARTLATARTAIGTARTVAA